MRRKMASERKSRRERNEGEGGRNLGKLKVAERGFENWIK